MNDTSKRIKEVQKKLSNQRKEKSEKAIKEKLDKKEIDYDTVQLILKVIERTKSKWTSEYFDGCDSMPDRFRGKGLPENSRESMMLGIMLGTMRANVTHNLRNREFTEGDKKSIDELVWTLIWYEWKEKRMLHDYASDKNNNSTD